MRNERKDEKMRGEAESSRAENNREKKPRRGKTRQVELRSDQKKKIETEQKRPKERGKEKIEMR